MGYQHPPQKTPTPLSSQDPLKSANCPSPLFLFRQSPLLYRFFVSSPPKSLIFQWTPKILKFLSLTPSYLWKVTKFLVKISQFEFLVTTEKNIFVCKLFLPLNISDFSLFFVKTATTSEKSYPFFSCQALPFWKFGKRLNPPLQHYGIRPRRLSAGQNSVQNGRYRLKTKKTIFIIYLLTTCS